ncbi:MAG TPA: serine--tRNA ligase [Candidatus Eremiobacteraceae bacterium]|nr:serine--tRNA ligase [Candidatus Eremiobacteraceae bacterium]
MLDRHAIREDPDRFRRSLRRRGVAPEAIDEFLELDRAHRALVTALDGAKAERNRLSAEFAQAKSGGADAIADLRRRSSELGESIKTQEAAAETAEARIAELLANLPNVLADDVPDGRDESANVEVGRFLEPTRFAFAAKPHWEIGERLGILDFERGVRLARSRFTVLAAMGARLNRALATFFLERNRAAGFAEISPPVLVNRESLWATGQLSKFSDAMFSVDGGELFLSPTSEVQLVNLHRDEILEADGLPICYTAFTSCFRQEAGAAGKDTRGLIRQHQFEKVEMVSLCTPDQTAAMHEKIAGQARSLLEELRLPYRMVVLSAGDTGFAARKTFDIEVWLPGQDAYREISSCSDCGDFQARRAMIRFRPQAKARPEFVHTLNGSGLALGRTLVAILENYQQADGSVVVPDALRPYLDGIDHIGP